MTYKIAVIKDGMVLYKNTENLPDVIPNQLLGAKAFQNLRCDCGGKATGMSGWIGEYLKMRVKCHACGKDFFIEKKFPGNTLQMDMNYLQRNEEYNFLRKYHERLEYKREEPKALEAPEKKSQVYEQKEGAQIIEVDFSRKENRLLDGLREIDQQAIFNAHKEHQDRRNKMLYEEDKVLSIPKVKCIKPCSFTAEENPVKKSFWQFLKAFFQ